MVKNVGKAFSENQNIHSNQSFKMILHENPVLHYKYRWLIFRTTPTVFQTWQTTEKRSTSKASSVVGEQSKYIYTYKFEYICNYKYKYKKYKHKYIENVKVIERCR